MLTQIWTATDIIFCHFRPSFALLLHYWPWKLKFGKNVKKPWRYYPFTHVHHNSRSYDVWSLRYKVQTTELFVILGHFHLLALLTTQKIKILKKIKKKTPGDIIILHLCPTNDDHMMSVSWDIENNIIFCHFRLFLTLYLPNNLENHNFEKNEKKTAAGIIILNMSIINENHMMYHPWDMEHDRLIFLSFWTIFCPFTPPPTS